MNDLSNVFFSNSLIANVIEMLALLMLIIDVSGLTDKAEGIIDACRVRFIELVVGKRYTVSESITNRWIEDFPSIVYESAKAGLKNSIRLIAAAVLVLMGEWDPIDENSALPPPLFRLLSIPLSFLCILISLPVSCAITLDSYPDSTPWAFTILFMLPISFISIAFALNLVVILVAILFLISLMLLYEALELMDKLPGRSVSAVGLILYLSSKAVQL